MTPLYRHMPLAIASAAWLVGIAASALYGDRAWLFAVALAAATLAYALVRRDRVLYLYIGVLPALFAGAVLLEQHARAGAMSEGVSQYRDGPAMRVRGVVRDDAERRDTSQRFVVSLREVQVRGAWEQATGGVVVRTGLLPPYRAGDVVELEGELATPPEVEGFDYGAYLALRGIGSVMEYPQTRVIGRDEPPAWRAAVLSVRRRLSHGLAVSLPEPQASLAQGVLLGERSALPPDVGDDLNVSNTSHLVVVSGSNVVYVSVFCTMFLSVVLNKRRALLLSLLAVAAYGLLVGASPPVLRAMVMGFVVVGARVSGRRTDGLTSILFAAALLTAQQPLAVRDVSFQLSFAATAGILTFASPLRQACVAAAGALLRRDDVPRAFGPLVADPVSVTVAALLATTPLITLYFGRLSLVALPANMLVVPAFPLILGASLLAAVGGLLPWGHIAFGTPAYVALSYWLAVARSFASIPYAALATSGLHARDAIAAYVLLIAGTPLLLRALRRVDGARMAPSRPDAWRRAVPFALAVTPLVALAGSAFVIWPSSAPARLEVTMLDVGQGDAILIETPSGQDVLIDGGPGRAVLRGLSDELAWNDRSLGLVVLTHPQADHVTGLLDVLDRYDVRRVITGASPAGAPSLSERAWRDAVADEGLVAEPASAGMSFDLGDGVLLEVLAPTDATARDDVPNNRAAVLRLSWRDVSLLLTGDIEARTEDALVASGADLRATVLKVAHHGSATSSSQAFLAAVQPSISVVSAGRDNQYGHPVPEVITRLDAYGPVYVTASDGAVHVETDGTRLWIR